MKVTRAYTVRTGAGYHVARPEDIEKHGRDVAMWMTDNRKSVTCATSVWIPGSTITTLYCEEDE